MYHYYGDRSTLTLTFACAGARVCLMCKCACTLRGTLRVCTYV